jgi:alkylated DNA nucleotide flippase Atl1
MSERNLATYVRRPNDAPTALARLLVDLANLVPAGLWIGYGDLGVAAGMRTKDGRRGLATEVARGATSALSFRPTREGIETWRVPWHRVRLANGHLKSRHQGEITDPHDLANLMFLAEGGKLSHGAASQLCRYSSEALRERAIDAGIVSG